MASLSGGTCAVVGGLACGGKLKLPTARRPRVDRLSPILTVPSVLLTRAGAPLGSEKPPAAPPGTGAWLGGDSLPAGLPAVLLAGACESLGSRPPPAEPP